ncbi:hypothetical protein LCGC14_0997300 [marine sediment metagenome]|uniref:Glycosyl transferase family 28 C-terminal domain-containing protein n=1 Tax=marine sediment metagenome TaxID=412755 RepID=A0A0F9RAB3_9ZZZZ
MSIREKSIFKKHAFEYEGPDGDIWDIVVVEAEGRKYVQFNKVVKGDDPLDPITMDGEMLLEMADAYRKATSKVSSTFSPHLKAPSIQDHRGLTKSEQIQEQVDKSMANQDHDTQPIQSLSPGQDEFAELIYSPSTTEMKKEMMDSDISITAGGQAVYELASVGVPAITVAAAENQLNSVKICDKLGINFYAGWWSDKKLLNNIKNLISNLKDQKLRRLLMEKGQKLIKPDGSRRIIEYLIKKYNNN